MSICIVLDRLNPKYNQKEASTTILKIRSQVRSASFFQSFVSLNISKFLLCIGFVVSSVCLSKVCYIGRGGEGEREEERERGFERERT